MKNIDELKSEIEKNVFLKFDIKVITNAKNNSIEFSDDTIKVKITALPIEGKANKAVIKFLSEITKIPKSNISIVKGEKSNIKTILIKK